MIIKSFNLHGINKKNSNFFLFYGENEGLKEEELNKFFIKDFKGEVIKYDENQILDNKESFFETCLNESLFESEKIISVSRVSSKSYEIIKELIDRRIHNKKIVLNAGVLEKKSKIRQLFEKDQNLICVAFYQDNNLSLVRVANSFFRENKISISNENINLIIEKCSGDRKNLQNEMQKILNFCFEKKKITREEILKLINLYDDENYFELVDNFLAKNHKKVSRIINNNSFTKNDSIIIIRSFLSRLKRLDGLKKMSIEKGNVDQAITLFKPPIFWKEKEIVKEQINSWSKSDISILIEEVHKLEIEFKKNSNLSNNLIYDFMLNTTGITNN